MNYSNTTVSLWFYNKNEVANSNNGFAANDDNFKSFMYKAKLIGISGAAIGILEDAAIALCFSCDC